MFNSFEIDDIKYGEIMTHKKSKELSELMGTALDQYKFVIQGKKYYNLLSNKIKMENIFGSLVCSDLNIKVNIIPCLPTLFKYAYLITLIKIYFKMDSSIVSAAQQISFLALTGFKNKSLSLLWRGSRDGFDANVFHSLCDGKENTVTVIKNTNGFIFGGFTSIPWSRPNSGILKTDSTAFLFSLTNPSNNSLILKVELPENAVYHHSNYGPTFGGGPDLYVSSLSNTNKNSHMDLHSYEFPNRKSGKEGGNFIKGGADHKFQTVEIEVYQVF